MKMCVIVMKIMSPWAATETWLMMFKRKELWSASVKTIFMTSDHLNLWGSCVLEASGLTLTNTQTALTSKTLCVNEYWRWRIKIVTESMFDCNCLAGVPQCSASCRISSFIRVSEVWERDHPRKSCEWLWAEWARCRPAQEWEWSDIPDENSLAAWGPYPAYHPLCGTQDITWCSTQTTRVLYQRNTHSSLPFLGCWKFIAEFTLHIHVTRRAR